MLRILSSFQINIIALIIGFGLLYWTADQSMLSSTDRIIIVTITMTIFMLLSDPYYKNPIKRKANTSRVFRKVLTVYIVYILLALLFISVPFYRIQLDNEFFVVLKSVLPLLILITPLYVYITDRKMANPNDVYSRLLLLQVSKAELKELSLSWLVKFMFLPYMFIYGVARIYEYEKAIDKEFFNFSIFFDASVQSLYMGEILFVVIGYTMTLKLFNTEIKSTEPTVKGWLVAMITYEPLSLITFQSFFAYNQDQYYWGHWLENSPIMYTLWGTAILILLFIYMLSSVTFGIRFSNLTNRGIITNGMFKYFKHPAYTSKVLSWWLISIPFINKNNNYAEMLSSVFALSLLSYIYYLRAKTEEEHLLNDKDYQEYIKNFNK